MSDAHCGYKSPGGQRNRTWIALVLAVVVPLVIIAGAYEYLLWSYYRTSASFKASARSAILAMNECASDIDKPGDECDVCLRRAREKLDATRSATRTTADRGIYYQSLQKYLKTIETSRREWEVGDTSPQARRHLDEMISPRTDLARWLNK